MAPLLGISECVGVTAGPHNRNSTGVPDHDLDKDDKNALLYIVITLLFYSMGIVVGIITYLKRERADIEEEKLFDMYLAMKGDHSNAMHRQEQVRQMARQLRKLERAKAARLERERLAAELAQDTNESGTSDVEVRAHTPKGDSKKSKHVKISDCVRTPSTRSKKESSGTENAEGTVLYPLVISTAKMIVGSTTVLSPILHVPSPCEHPPAAVTKHGEHGRRGALPVGHNKALYEWEHGQTCDPDTIRLVSGPVVNKPSSVDKNSVHSSSNAKGENNIDT